MVKKGKRPGKTAKTRGGREGACSVSVTQDGPYIVSGSLPMNKEIIVPDKEGIPCKWKKGEAFPKQGTYALCRCGHSLNKPYCSGKHAEVGFVGAETAGNRRYLEQAEKIPGGAICLTDAVAFCASARFCDRGAGTWQLAVDSKDPKKRKMAIQQACDCPSGRLVAWDKKGKAIEPKHKPSIGIIEDPGANASGPIWVKGGVPVISACGERYEVRNRVTLCRCGKSGNKPFCDGTHIQTRFNDGDKRLKKQG